MFGQTILFQDNFNDGNAERWEFFGDQGWHVVNGQYGILLNSGKSSSVPSDQYWSDKFNNYVFEADLRGTAGTDKNLIFHFIDSSNFYDLHHTGGKIDLAKYINSIGSVIAGPINYPLENDISYHFKIEVDGDDIRISINNDLLFALTDSNPKIVGGKIGLRAGTGAVWPTEVWFDNVLVTQISTLPNLFVPEIKQTDPLWKDKIYDHALSWTQADATINRWGCALTSASMVLKYHGFSMANPDLINNWLINQPDGYIRNGLVNWLALSRFSKIYATDSLPILEYRRAETNKEMLIDELMSSRPAILEEPGHFVVAKSQLPTTFGINDPYYEDRTTLSSYGDSFLSIGSYLPSNTDLSYVLLVTGVETDIRLFSASGEEIVGKSFVQNPLQADSGVLAYNAPALKMVLFPKPKQEDYKIVLQGNNEYQLDSYIYDKEGNVTTNTYFGNLYKNQPDQYIISIPRGRITKEVSLTSIMNDMDTAYENGLFKNLGLYNAIKQLLFNASRLLSSKNKSYPK